MGKDLDTPYGPDAVRLAVLEAATELFARQGVRATSIRQIAAQARVNHGLVHKYFGSKEALITQTLERHALAIRAYAESGELASPPAQALVEQHWRMLAYAVLEGEDLGDVTWGSPVAEMLLDRARASGLSAKEARLSVGRAIALQLGWQMFQPVIERMLELPKSESEEIARGALGRYGRPARPAAKA